MTADLTLILGSAAAAMTVAAAAGRAVTTLRTRSVSGVSVLWTGLAILINVGFGTYGLLADVWPQVVGSAAWLAALGLVCYRLSRARAIEMHDYAIWGAAVCAMLIIALVQPDLAAYLAGFIAAASAYPQAFKILRTNDAHGVGVGAWALSWVMTALWVGYGVAAGLAPIWVPNVVALIGVSAVVVLAARAARTSQ